MIDYDTIKENLELEILANGLEVVNNTLAISADPLIKSKIISKKIQDATMRAYNKRRGSNATDVYTFDMFEDEADKYQTTITNMAYTAFTKIGIEGVLGNSENGISNSYESGGLYLKSDLANIMEKAGVL